MNLFILRWALSSLLEVRSTCASMSSSILPSVGPCQLWFGGQRIGEWRLHVLVHYFPAHHLRLFSKRVDHARYAGQGLVLPVHQ